MFSFKYAIFCMLAGLLAGWSFDKKNDNIILGAFIYLFIYSGFYVNFPYDSSWSIVAVIEVIAGHGLYKMGLGDFLGELFFNPGLKDKTKQVRIASKAAKHYQEAATLYKHQQHKNRL